MRCFPDVVGLRAFTTAKDVTESMGAIHAASKHGNITENGGGISEAGKARRGRGALCLCIGDGSTPRTAVLAAFIERWEWIVSIDPALGQEWVGRHETVQGLTGYAGTLEQFLVRERAKKESEHALDSSETREQYDHLILLCVHSHARFVGAASIPDIRSVYGNPRTTLVSLPCCPGFRHVRDIKRPPDVSYEDDCVFSACRTVQVWNFDKDDKREERAEEMDFGRLCGLVQEGGQTPGANNSV